MEKRLRSSLQTSADEFLISATKLGFKAAKPSLRTLIHTLTSSSPITSSLPLSLHQSISKSVTKLKQLCTTSISATPPSPPTKRHRRSSRHSDNNDGDDDKRVEVKKFVVESLQIYSYVVLMCVTHPKKVFSPADLLPSACELHDNLVLFEFDLNLMVEVTNLCEEWWKEDVIGRENLITQSIPALLSRSLTLKKKVDVHKVYGLREALTLFEFEDESIVDLKLLLLRCFVTPWYLKTEDGRKFLAFLFGLSRQLVKEALAMIRFQIPYERKSVLEAYAEVVFRAWKNGDRELREEIEDRFMQDLVEGAIHAKSVQFAASVRRLFGGFISQRTHAGVEKLLLRLVEPLIFRSLQVRNSNVRLNTLHLFLDLFPLEDPNTTKEEKDILLEKQFFLLHKLLTDECPAVRVVAVEGCCRVLRLFWEIITPSTITKLLTKVFDDMTHDKSKDVRLSTLEGIKYLLGNPQSHALLKVLLPRVGHLILDSSLSVRAAVVDLLLLLLCDIPNIQFHKVVRLDVLLSTLAKDQRLVAQKITKLLMPSFFPSTIAPEEACSRCVQLIKRSPKAGARFCEFALSEGASLRHLKELFKAFISLVLLPGRLAEDQVDALLCASACICNSLASEPSYKIELKKELSGEKLKRLFTASSTGCAQSSVCSIVSTIFPEGVAGCIEECLGLVTNCSGVLDNLERQAEVRSAHRMMVSCDCFDYMFETLARLLQKTANACHLKFGLEKLNDNISLMKPRKTKSSNKISAKPKHTIGNKSFSSSNRFEDDYIIAAGISWQIKDLLISADTRKGILESGCLEIAFFSLKVISEVSMVQSKQCDYVMTPPVLAYTALALCISSENVTFSGINNQSKAKERSGRSSSEQTLLDQTMDHLLSCSSKLLTGVADSVKPSRLSKESGLNNNRDHHRGQKKTEIQPNVSSPSDDGPQKKMVSNMVKMLTAVLKFVVDASVMELISHIQTRCLNFTLKYLEFIISSLEQHSWYNLQCQDNDMKETFLCLKSSFTYATKILNFVLRGLGETSPAPPEAYVLSNKLLDLSILVEEHMGSRYAARIVAAAKPWLTDLILGLGSWNMKQPPRKSASYFGPDQIKSSFPSWPTSLAKVELIEIGSKVADDDTLNSKKIPAFSKFVMTMVQLFRANHDVLDAVGVIFLTGTIVGLEREDFHLVLGFVHFVCAKLVGHNEGDWGELKMMLESLQVIYPQIERKAEELNNGEEGLQNLLRARNLLEPIWMRHLFETGAEAMEEE